MEVTVDKNQYTGLTCTDHVNRCRINESEYRANITAKI